MSAKSNVPWSVKGIDADARSVAKELAKRQGMTLGEWMTAMIREKGLDEAGYGEAPREPDPSVVSGVTTDQLRDVIGSLNRLTDRISAAEKSMQVADIQSREAMGGLNKGLETVFERIKRLERTTPEGLGVDSEDIAEIAERLDRLEGHGEKRSWVDSLKALERALSTLVEQVEASRDETEERLARNEDILDELKTRLDADDDDLRSEIGDLLEAIDKTTERVAATEERVGEALGVARKAAESHDETFIERTSNNLRLLGSEIKRTSDQIRTLESSVDKLQDKIEAGEQRSAEGISRVAQSLDTLREQIEAGSLNQGKPSAETVRQSVAEAEKRMDAVQGAFSAVVDRLEGHVSTSATSTDKARAKAPQPDPTPDPVDAAAPTAPQPGPTAPSVESDDPFDRPFDDPLGFASTPEPKGKDDPGQDPEARATQLAPPFGGLTGPGTMAIGNVALDQSYYGAAFVDAPAPAAAPVLSSQPNAHDEPPALEETRIDPDADSFPGTPPAALFETPKAPLRDLAPASAASAPSASAEWTPPSNGDDRPSEPIDGFERDPLFSEDETDRRGWGSGDGFTGGLRNRFSTDVENNPALGWVLIAIAVSVIIFAALRFTAPDDMEPMVIEAAAPAQQAPAPAAVSREPVKSLPALYAEGKELIATGTTEAERERGVALLTEAAEGGISVAQHDLAELYLSGGPVIKNGLAARRWFNAAADNGHVPSVNRLAYLDIKGIGGPVDIAAAISGFTRAAQAGYPKAMVNLGTLYNPDNAWLPEGQRSAAESYYWFRLAELRGDTSALSDADLVAALLPDQVRTSMETRAAAWRPVPLSR
ncbi:MAG: hypothetical protein AAGH41_10585 [Pseudomonadota bacterium]